MQGIVYLQRLQLCILILCFRFLLQLIFIRVGSRSTFLFGYYRYYTIRLEDFWMMLVGGRPRFEGGPTHPTVCT